MKKKQRKINDTKVGYLKNKNENKTFSYSDQE